MNAARSGMKLYSTLREEGFDASDFPDWWYKPAIAEVLPDPNQLAPSI